jgi:hypothetical protein
MQSFLANLKYFYKEGEFTPSIKEEFVNLDGSLDQQYIQHVSETKVGLKKFTSLVNTEFGTTKFKAPDPLSNEVTRAEFLEQYEFGKFPQVRSWIGFWRTHADKVLSRECLHCYILSTSAPKGADHGAHLNTIE